MTGFQWVLCRDKEFLVAIKKASPMSQQRFGCRDMALGSQAVCVVTQIFGSRRWYSSVRLVSVEQSSLLLQQGWPYGGRFCIAT